MAMPLFVYGTLLSRGSQHARMAGARLLGPARTRPEMSLVDLGWHPALLAGGSTAVVGELYAVDDEMWAELDAFEDAPSWYQRVAITLEDGSEAHTYLMPTPCGEPIASGDWIAHFGAA